MPFDAAKAVAATFCYHIRYALTPVFGLDFPSLCIEPGDESFSRMVIDRSIVRKCTEEAKEYRRLSGESFSAGSISTPPSATRLLIQTPRSLRPKPAKLFDSESGYGTDTDRSDKYLCSPQTSFQWTALNTPRSTVANHHHSEVHHDTVSSLIGGSEAPPNSPQTSSSESDGGVKRAFSESDEDCEEADPLNQELRDVLSRSVMQKQSLVLPKESRAAYLLMQLHMADASLKDDVHGVKRRRASS